MPPSTLTPNNPNTQSVIHPNSLTGNPINPSIVFANPPFILSTIVPSVEVNPLIKSITPNRIVNGQPKTLNPSFNPCTNLAKTPPNLPTTLVPSFTASAHLPMLEKKVPILPKILPAQLTPLLTFSIILFSQVNLLKNVITT